MKKLLVTTWMAALTALVGCQQNDELLTNPEAPPPEASRLPYLPTFKTVEARVWR